MQSPYTVILYRNPLNQLEVRSYPPLDTRFQAVLTEALSEGLTPLAYSEGDGQMMEIKTEQQFLFTHKPATAIGEVT